MNHVLFFEMDNWSLADDLTCCYFIDNGSFAKVQIAKCIHKKLSLGLVQRQLEIFFLPTLCI
jgi:hypothetical protein